MTALTQVCQRANEGRGQTGFQEVVLQCNADTKLERARQKAGKQNHQEWVFEKGQGSLKSEPKEDSGPPEQGQTGEGSRQGFGRQNWQM